MVHNIVSIEDQFSEPKTFYCIGLLEKNLILHQINKKRQIFTVGNPKYQVFKSRIIGKQDYKSPKLKKWFCN